MVVLLWLEGPELEGFEAGGRCCLGVRLCFGFLLNDDKVTFDGCFGSRRGALLMVGISCD